MITYLQKDIQLSFNLNQFLTEYQIPILDNLIVWGTPYSQYACINFKRDFKQDEFVEYYSPVDVAPSCKNYIYNVCYDFLIKNIGFSTSALDPIDNKSVELQKACITNYGIYQMEVAFEIFNSEQLIKECDNYYRWVNGFDIG